MRNDTERPIARVPLTVAVLLAATLAIHVLLRQWSPPDIPPPEALRPLPGTSVLRVIALGDPLPLARALTLYLQSFDMDSVHRIPYQRLDYGRLEQWLAAILDLDPIGQYPLLLAARLYAETPDPIRSRRMLDFVHARFIEDPERRWPWLAHAASIAKHRLQDLALARRYAAAIQTHATGPGVPLWARQMEAFILEDMDELELARIMIGGFLASGQIHDPGEIRFLEGKLEELEHRSRSSLPSRK